ncbi:MAG: alpha-1,4-glucan--maltose-1-phosphate maltosyltransferase [Polyangiales bacterium]
MGTSRKRVTKLRPIEDRGRIYIENVTPAVDAGRYRTKAQVGVALPVAADVLRDGHDLLRAVVRFAPRKARKWGEAELTYDALGDRWHGAFAATAVGLWKYEVEAWTDRFGTWRRDLEKRAAAHQDLDVELEVGAELIEARAKKATKTTRAVLATALKNIRAKKHTGEGPTDSRVQAALDDALLAAMRALDPRTDSVTSPTLELTVDRKLGVVGAWYEFFPRSTGERAGEHGTFRTAIERLPHIASMGFDVIYLPPIHPIGTAHRKGKNNTLIADKHDVGSPWAIGSKAGGHTAVHPDLGTLADFDAFVRAANGENLEVALDFAVQCAPDHPWVKQHPDWFQHRPDGSIRYAENPPKKYQDIYPIDFDTKDKQGLWNALRDVLAFWVSHGVKVFRVDNPHTKSFAFWEWAIDSLKADNPELVFLAEAFTRPKVMATLAKLGFTQSYTYFTWKNTRWELEAYLRELVGEHANYFRPNFFANTPDILHEYLQTGGAAAFRIRLALAATLSPTYGIYSGYEFYENVPLREGSEEYLDSEKYQLRQRPLDAKGSLVPMIRTLNETRRAHPCLESLTNLVFHHADKDAILTYSKRTGDDCVLVVANLNPHSVEEATVHVDLSALGVSPSRPYQVRDVLSNDAHLWQGGANYVRLSPEHPVHVFHVTQS